MKDEMFTKQDCHYNPDRDITPVDPEGVVNLKDAFVNGLIPDDVSVGDAEFDNNDNPRSIIGRPSNEFDAIHLKQTLQDIASKASEPAEN